MTLAAGSFLRLAVEQGDIDLAVELYAPDGTKLQAADRPSASRGAELLLAVPAAAGRYRLEIRAPEKGKPGTFLARIEAWRPALPEDRQLAAAYVRFLAAGNQPGPDPAAVRQETRAVFQQLGEWNLAALALLREAQASKNQRDFAGAAVLYEKAAEEFSRLAGESPLEAASRNGLGACQLTLGRAEAAALSYGAALAAARRGGPDLFEALAHHGLSQAGQRLGDLQQALDHGERALALWPPDTGEKRPETLHNLGVLYARRFRDPEKGRRLFEEALAAYAPDHPIRIPTLSQLGRLEAEAGRLGAARQAFEQALELRREEADPCPRVVLLGRLAQVDLREGEAARADLHLAAARELLAKTECPLSRPTFEGLAADLELQRGAAPAAAQSFGRAAELYHLLGDPLGESESLAGLARAERAMGARDRALAAALGAIELLEVARPAVLREDLRTSLFSAGRQSFDLAIALLTEQRRAAAAWSLAEQARARALRDLLESVPAVDSAGTFAGEERQLLLSLNELEWRRLNLRDNKRDLLFALRDQKAEMLRRLERLRGERRRRDPLYARLAAPPAAPSLEAARRALLDAGAGTAILEYHLGEESGTLWVIGREAVAMHSLPPRREIEALAGSARADLRSLEWKGERPAPLCRLAEILLAPALPLAPRLVIVPDGALASFPWAALPAPGGECEKAPFLIESHEISFLPSVSTLFAQRRQLLGRRPAAGLAAIFADPAYGPDWGPLPESAEEATAIAALLPAGRTMVVSGTEASRARALSAETADYRILHFATHGVFDAESPLLSGLVLAQRDPAGRPIEGHLRACELYGRELGAELVVLSACETGLGREVAGEGLVSGLPRAFLAAGARRVLVSLWPVGDRESRELMTAFYRGLAERRLAPARALQEAQAELRRQGRPPYAWAGYALLGDFSNFDLGI